MLLVITVNTDSKKEAADIINKIAADLEANDDLREIDQPIRDKDGKTIGHYSIK